MLADPTILDEHTRARIARRSALMLAAIHLHKQEIGLPISTPPIDADESALLAEAREKLETARRSNGHDVWGVMHNISHHDEIKRFLEP